MKVDDLLNDIGDLLQEDFLYASLWSKSELLGYLRQTIREFSARTKIIDRHAIRLVSSTTGEASVPDDFSQAYYVRFGGSHVDVVAPNELDFADDDWGVAGTGSSPLGCTVYGAGAQAKIRFAPVPSNADYGTGGGSVAFLRLSSPDGTVWNVSISDGELVATGSTGTTTAPVITSRTKYWDLSINNDGELGTALSASTSDTVIYLIDTTTGDVWWLKANDDGELSPSRQGYGKITWVKLDGAYQEFGTGMSSTSSWYGTIADCYATGVSVAPAATVVRTKPLGAIAHARCANQAADVWYKGYLDDVPTLESELLLADPFLAVVKRGVLAKALSREGDGQDLDKAKLLNSLFAAECEAIKSIFGGRE